MANVKHQVAIVALVIALTGSLAACGNPVKDAVDKAVGNAVDNGVEKVIENAAGEDVDLDINVSGDGAKLPDSFPDAIPRPDGKLILASAQQDGWQLAYEPQSASVVESLIAEYGSWTTQAESDYGELKSWQFVNDDYLVIISAIQDDDQWTISLLVAAVTE